MNRKVVEKRIEDETVVPSLIKSGDYQYIGKDAIQPPRAVNDQDNRLKTLLMKKVAEKRKRENAVIISLKFELNKDEIEHISWTERQISEEIVSNPGVIDMVSKETVKDTDTKTVIIVRYSVKKRWFNPSEPSNE